MDQQYLQIIGDFEARAAVVEPAEASELADLLQRLRHGAEWLTAVNSQLFSTPDAGVGTEQEGRFCEGLALWDELERDLRITFPGYIDCILGPGQRCPAAAPVRCAACDGSAAEGPSAASEPGRLLPQPARLGDGAGAHPRP